MNLTRTEAIERASIVKDVQSYRVELDLTRGERVFGSKTTVRFSAEPGADTFIDAVTDSVRSVTLNGKALDPAGVADGVRIALPDLEAENELVVDADALYMNTGEGLHRFVDPVDGEVYLYTQFEVPDSRRMFAVFEQPDLKSEFTFVVTAPEHWSVVSNEPTPEPVPAHEGAKTWEFPPTPRMSSYITALIAGPYKGVFSSLTSSSGREIELGVYTRASMAEYMDADNVFELTRQGFAFYEEQFGTPYPFTKYDQLFVPDFNAGAMENAGAVTYLESYVFRGKVTEAVRERRAITILHELAHMWFGDLVTMKWWNDLWLNESFAEFMCHLSAAEATEFTDAWTSFAAADKWWAYSQDQLPTTHPIVAEIRDLDDVQVNFDGITYAKGASVLRQLVAWVGQERFMEGVRAYFAKHAWGNTELPDLLSELEASSGRDLSAWGKAWLQTSGVTTLAAEFEVEDGTYRNVAVVQSSPDADKVLPPHRLGIGVYADQDGRLVRTHRVEIDVDGARTSVPELDGVAAGDLLVVNDGDLAYGNIRLDDASFAVAKARLADVEDSLTRVLLWGAAVEGVRDAEIAPTEFLDLVAANIPRETTSTVVSMILRQARVVLQNYVVESRRAEVAESLAARVLEALEAAEPGSDMQLQLMQFFAVTAADAKHASIVKAVLDGERTLEGLELDSDLKWTLLQALVASGAAGEAEIASMLESDNTANGALAAAQARAAVPGSEAKKATMDLLFTDRSIPNLTLRMAAMGFQSGLDTQAHRELVDEFFSRAREIKGKLSHEVTQTLVRGLYPSRVVSRTALDASAAFIASLGEEDAAIKRMVVESHDGLARALRVQEAFPNG
ncbi:aminopeptidase N [Falsarthrobacter nasiphocae]